MQCKVNFSAIPSTLKSFTINIAYFLLCYQFSIPVVERLGKYCVF